MRKWASNGHNTNRYQIKSRLADTIKVPKCEGGCGSSERAEGKTKSKGKTLGLVQSIWAGTKSVRNKQARSANTGKR